MEGMKIDNDLRIIYRVVYTSLNINTNGGDITLEVNYSYYWKAMPTQMRDSTLTIWMGTEGYQIYGYFAPFK